jgi:glucokinase
MEHVILGIDIGGTSIKAGVLVSGHLQDIRSIPTPALESQEVILEALATFIERYLPYSFEGIGIGIGEPQRRYCLGFGQHPFLSACGTPKVSHESIWKASFHQQ